MNPVKLVTVGVDTRLGAHYSFPDVELDTVNKLLAQDNPLEGTTLTLVNVSDACLLLPTRIIAKVIVDGELRWTA